LSVLRGRVGLPGSAESVARDCAQHGSGESYVARINSVEPMNHAPDDKNEYGDWEVPILHAAQNFVNEGKFHIASLRVIYRDEKVSHHYG
jgi:hypothetical protein